MACPYASIPLRTTARMTALRPGQSPPPVSTPIRAMAGRLGRKTNARPGRAGAGVVLSLSGRGLVLGAAGLGQRLVVALELRQPAQRLGQVPVVVAQELHGGRQQHGP